jgi:hypothetical protein
MADPQKLLQSLTEEFQNLQKGRFYLTVARAALTLLQT